MEKLYLVTNPGSSSRKYALYHDDERLICSLHFETENKSLICTLKRADGSSVKLTDGFKRLADTIRYTRDILVKENYLHDGVEIAAILARVAATGDFFSDDHIVDEDCLRRLEEEKRRAPLHVPVIAAEISECLKTFPGTPVITISDSHFHHTRDDVHKYYAIDLELADRAEIKRYGYHGLSMGAVRNFMRDEGILPSRVVACHLGSGASLTAIKDGYSYDTTMGYTPLEGVMMATRCGDLDPAAASAIQRELGFTEEGLEEYLNRQCGLLGVTGKTNDMREVIELRDNSDPRAELAYDMYIYRIQRAIGEMVAAMHGLDALVFTATIGERNAMIRQDIVAGCGYLNLELDPAKNKAGLGKAEYVNIATKKSLPIYVIQTNETDAMIRRAKILLAQQKQKEQQKSAK